MRCSILFVAALQVILIGARHVVGGVRLTSGQKLSPLRGFMDDITNLLPKAPCTCFTMYKIAEEN